MLLGLDLHGTINKNPRFFSGLTKKFRDNGHEIHILTGVEKGLALFNELNSLGVEYDKLFSITTYLKEQKIPVIYKDNDPTQPLFDNEHWDVAKATYCCQSKVDIHIDDSLVYGKYFWAIKTQYLVYNESLIEFINTISHW